MILGRVLLRADEAAASAKAALYSETLTLSLKKDRWSKYTKASPHIGDLYWCQEPYIEWVDKRRGWNDDIVYGSGFSNFGRPEQMKNRPWEFLRRHVKNGEQLSQKLSRFTLEVIEKQPEAHVLCRVHPENIQTFKLKAAA